MPRRPSRARIAACLLLVSLAPCCADPAPVIHYAPAENLEHIDVALIDRAEQEIDMDAYVLTDWPVMLALTRAASAAGNGLVLQRQDLCALGLGLLYIKRRLGLAKFFESPIGSFERIVEMTSLVVLVE
jgi:hypothetical protein